jgi:hypothetical protein
MADLVFRIIDAEATGSRARSTASQLSQSIAPRRKYDELIDLLRETAEEELITLVQQHFETNPQTLFDFLNALKRGIVESLGQDSKDQESSSQHFERLRFSLLKRLPIFNHSRERERIFLDDYFSHYRVLNLLSTRPTSWSDAEKIFTILADLMEGLHQDERLELVRSIVHDFSLCDGNFCHSCTFLPSLLSDLSRVVVFESSEDNDSESEQSEIKKPSVGGEQYRRDIIDQICEVPWTSSITISMTQIMKEFPLTPEQYQIVSEKLLGNWKDLPLSDIPQALHHILLFSTKGSRGSILLEIVKFFDSLDAKARKGSSDQTKQIQGTSVLQINFAAKQDQEIGRQFLIALKKTSNRLTNFLLAILLSLSRIPTFQTSIFDFIKSSLLTTCQISNASSGSLWLQTTMKLSQESTQQLNDFAEVEKMLKEMISGSAFGWDHILPSLVDLGFSFLDLVLPKQLSNPNLIDKIVQIGRTILLETFKFHAMVQTTILGQIISQVLSCTDHVDRYILLLGDLVSNAPHDVRTHGNQIKELFDYLSQLPKTTSLLLLHSTMPLVCRDPNLQNYLILILRKAMFSSQLPSRVTAIEGFFSILKNLSSYEPSLGPTSSQSVLHQQHEETLFKTYYEIFGCLRRCTSQQWEVRKLLYEKLPKLFDHIPPTLQQFFFSLLHHQLSKYIVESSDNLPLNLFDALEGSKFGKEKFRSVETLGEIIQCSALCLTGYDSEGKNSDLDTNYLKLKQLLLEISNRFSSLQLSGVDWVQDCPTLSSELKPQMDLEAAFLIRDVLIGLIDFTFLCGSPDQLSESERRVGDLFLQYEKISEWITTLSVLKNKQTTPESISTQPAGEESALEELPPPKTKAGKSASTKASKSKCTPPSQPFGHLPLSLSSVEKFFSYDDNEAALLSLKVNEKFLRFILQNVKDQGCFSLSDLSVDDTPKYSTFSTVALMLVSYFQTNWKEAKNNSLCCFCLEIFHIIVEFCAKKYKEQVKDFLSQLILDTIKTETNESERNDEFLILHSLSFLLIELSKMKLYRECNFLIRLLHISLDQLSPEEMREYANIDNHHFLQFLHDGDANPVVVKPYVEYISRLFPYSLSSLQNVIDDFSLVLENSSSQSFPVINSKNIGIFVAGILESVEKMIDETDFVIGVIEPAKGSDASMSLPQEKEVVSRCKLISKIFRRLIESGVSGPPLDAILKLITKFYRSLHKLFKKFIVYSQLPSTLELDVLLIYTSKMKKSIQQFDFMAQDQSEEPKKRRKGSNLKSLLTFAFEQFEISVMKVSKRLRLELEQYITATRTRDFAFGTPPPVKKRKITSGDEE